MHEIWLCECARSVTLLEKPLTFMLREPIYAQQKRIKAQSALEPVYLSSQHCSQRLISAVRMRKLGDIEGLVTLTEIINPGFESWLLVG
jgi:hypothetical protein